MSKVIDSFTGEYAFLSNFYPTEFGSVEHLFQAAKTLDHKEQEEIMRAHSPGKAKRLGRKATLRSDWEEVKLDHMEFFLRWKFSNPELRQKLLDTGDATLVEGNHWGDTYWGVCRGKGENHLGKLLMKIREDLRA